MKKIIIIVFCLLYAFAFTQIQGRFFGKIGEWSTNLVFTQKGDFFYITGNGQPYIFYVLKGKYTLQNKQIKIEFPAEQKVPFRFYGSIKKNLTDSIEILYLNAHLEVKEQPLHIDFSNQTYRLKTFLMTHSIEDESDILPYYKLPNLYHSKQFWLNFEDTVSEKKHPHLQKYFTAETNENYNIFLIQPNLNHYKCYDIEQENFIWDNEVLKNNSTYKTFKFATLKDNEINEALEFYLSMAKEDNRESFIFEGYDWNKIPLQPTNKKGNNKEVLILNPINREEKNESIETLQDSITTEFETVDLSFDFPPIENTGLPNGLYLGYVNFELNEYEKITKDFNAKAKKVEYKILKAVHDVSDHSSRIKIYISTTAKQEKELLKMYDTKYQDLRWVYDGMMYEVGVEQNNGKFEYLEMLCPPEKIPEITNYLNQKLYF